MANEKTKDPVAEIRELRRRVAELEREASELRRFRESAAEALRASEARFHTFCQATPLGIFESDEQGSCTYVSTQWEKLTGRPIADLLGVGWREIIHPDDVAAAREIWRQAHASGRPYVNEFRVVLASGELRWARAVARRVDDGGTGSAKYIGCVEDITERKQAELDKRESEDRFHAFMDNSPAVAFMKDTAGRRVYANAPYVKLFQVGDDAVLGKTDVDMFGPDVARRLSAIDERVLSEGRQVQSVEAVPTPDGVMHDWLTYKFPVDTRSGERYVGGVAIDISEWRSAEEALRRAHRQSEGGQRQIATGDARPRERRRGAPRRAGSVARLLYQQEADRKLIAYEIHDGLVQYVAAAVLQLESAKAALIAPPAAVHDPLAAALGLLRDAIQEARRLINGLQPLVLDRSGVVAAIDCLIDEHFDPCIVQFAHHMRSERLTPLLESALFRICQEALTNATRHSGSTQVQVNLRQEHAWVRLEVTDQGVGFNPDLPAANSFGLRGIRERARLLGGHAMIDSAPGEGTRIAVELPITDL